MFNFIYNFYIKASSRNQNTGLFESQVVVMSWLWSHDVNTVCLEVGLLSPDRGSTQMWFCSFCYMKLVMKIHISVAQPEVFLNFT